MISTVNASSPASESIYQDTQMGNTPGGVKASSALVYSVIADNSANSVASYVKLYNQASGSVIVGSSDPDDIILVPANQIVTVSFKTGALAGKSFGTALTVAAVTTGGTSGAVAPTNPVVVSVNFA